MIARLAGRSLEPPLDPAEVLAVRETRCSRSPRATRARVAVPPRRCAESRDAMGLGTDVLRSRSRHAATESQHEDAMESIKHWFGACQRTRRAHARVPASESTRESWRARPKAHARAAHRAPGSLRARAGEARRGRSREPEILSVGVAAQFEGAAGMLAERFASREQGR